MNLQKEIHVHFVCTGNAYRSRLAEAYLKAKQLPWLRISFERNSSGVSFSVEWTHLLVGDETYLQ